jgi:Ca2+-binding RTX toxin-like protein
LENEAMATKTAIVDIQTSNPPPMNLGEAFYLFLANIEGVSAATPTSFVAQSTDGSTFDVDILIEGTGFKYNSESEPTGGTATSFTITDNDNGDAPLVHATFAPGVSVAAVRAAADFLFENPGETGKLDAIFGVYTFTFNGNEGDDIWLSSKGNDTLFGDDGNDDLFGGAGNDAINGGDGDDELDGEEGIDTVSFFGSADPVTLALGLYNAATKETAQSDAQVGADLDSVANFENVIGTDGDDVLTGNAANNELTGGEGMDMLTGDAGDDRLLGGDDDDMLIGGAGKDFIDGGDGVDFADYMGAAAVTITLGNSLTNKGFKAAGGDAAGDTLIRIENIMSGDGADVLTGNEQDNLLGGGAGDDTLNGGLGNDLLDGFTGIDTASYATSAAGVTVDLNGNGTYVLGSPAGDAVAQLGGDAEGDELYGIENLIGSAKNDILTGNGENRLDGGAGDDMIVAGPDGGIFFGGAGIDTLSFENVTGPLVIDLGDQGKADKTRTGITTGGDGTGLIAAPAGADFHAAEFENVIGSADDDDVTGDKNANIIEGGAGADTLDGGLGIDFVSYEHSAAGVTITLGLGTAPDGGDATGDVLTGFEGVIGSGGDDQLYADQDSTKTVGYTLRGGDGDDYMQGGFGKDVLDGGDGNDEAFLGLGKGGDTFDGGDGEDWATFNSGVETAGITITLGADGTLKGFKASGGAANGSKISNVENLGGTTLNDMLTGNNLGNELDGGSLGNDVLSGMGGEDTLEGGDGDDKLIGGADADILDGGDGIDTVDYSASGGDGLVIDLSQQGEYVTPGDPDSGRDLGNSGVAGSGGDAEDDLFFGIENVIGSKSGDTLVAAAVGSKLDGGAGDDEVVGGAGVDGLIGGVGVDYAIFENSVGGITLNLSLQSTVDKNGNLVGGSEAHGGDAEGDKLSGIENVTGGQGDDVLIGDKNANTFLGNDGEDRLDGGAGNDTLNGGADDDTFVYDGLGKDVVEDFTQGEDTLEITGAPKTFTSVLDVLAAAELDGEGNTVITFDSKNTLTLLGFTGTLLPGDIVFNAPVVGTKSADNIQGNALVNKIDGAAGDDTIEGLGGGDTLIGGAGNDWLSYENSAAAVTVTLVAKQAAQTSGGDADGDIATLFENIIGSDNDDTLTGDAGVNVLMGGLGDDALDGAGGNDTVDYSYYVGGQGFQITIGLDASGNATTSGNLNDVDTLTSIENLTGGGENDFFTGNAGINVLKGGGGDDTLIGGGGKDTLDGGDGTDTVDFTGVAAGLTIVMKDTGATKVGGGGTASGAQFLNIERLIGGDGADKLTGNKGNNTINGGDGDDIVTATLGTDSYNGGDDNDTLTFAAFKTAVTVDLGAGNGSTTDGAYTISNFETLIGGSGSDLLAAGTGGGRVDGGAGNDTIIGGAGIDTLIGGAGINTLSYEDSASGVTVTLGNKGAAAGLSGGDASGDTATGFFNVIGSDGDDTLNGEVDSSANILDGGADGSDILTGGAKDTVSYASAQTGVDVTFVSGGAATVGGGATGDLLTGFLSIIGSNFNDTLLGDVDNETIMGGAGDDVLGSGGGIDILNGGDGSDVASFSGAGTAVFVNLATGAVTRDGNPGKATLQSVEVVFGSAHDDVFNAAGFSASSKNAGSTGISNQEGTFNMFRGGAGNDSITGNGVTRVRYDNAGSAVAVNLDNVAHQFGASPNVAGHQAMGVSSGIDTFGDGNLLHDTGISQVQGSSFQDVFWGSANDETFIGMGNNDAIFGGGGFDSARYNVGNSLSGANGILVNLAAGTVTGATGTATTAIGADSLDRIESIVGSNGDDTFDATGFDGSSTNAGDSGTFNNFEGVGGDDTVIGNGDTRVSYQRATGAVTVTLNADGSGTASGDSSVGNDTFTIGVVAVRGSEFNDEITGGGGGDLLDGWLGDDTLTGGTGEDTFKYSIGTQTGGGEDHIVGFELNFDFVDLRGTTVMNFTALQKLMKDVGDDLVIDFKGGNTLTIEDVHKADVTDSHFLLV